MARIAKPLIAACLALLGASAHAGYAQLATPAGFSGSAGAWQYAASASNDSVFGKVIHQPNGLKVPVPGSTAKMPAAYRLAANAPRIAAAAIFLHPGVRTAVSIATWLGAAAITYNAVSQQWEKVFDGEVSTGFDYTFDSANTGWHASITAAANAYLAYLKPTQNPDVTRTVVSCNADAQTCIIKYSNPKASMEFDTEMYANKQPAQCPAGSIPTPAGCKIGGTKPITTPEEFATELEPKPMPERVPLELPPNTPLPVEQPVINPEPGPNPAPRPLFVPSGDPVANPSYNPNEQPSPENQPFIQPGTRIKPSPTPDNPWRVDLEPVNIPKPSAEPTPETSDPIPEGTKPKAEDQQSLCEKHPDIVACAKMDEVEPEDVQNEDKTLTITPKSGWGNANAACPAPVSRQVAGLELQMSWQPFCDLSTGIRPVILALAWVAAAMMVIGVARKEG